MQKIKLILIIYALMVLVSVLLLPGIRVAHDFPYIYNESSSEGFGFPQLWSTRADGLGQFVNNTLWSWPVDLVYGSASRLGLPFELSYKLIGIAPAITLGLVGIYWLLRESGIRKDISILAAVFYVTTSYFLLLIDGGQLSIALAYGFFPLVFLQFEKAWTGKLNEKLLAATFFSLLGLLDPRFMYLLALLLLLRVTFVFLSTHKKIALLKQLSVLAIAVGIITLVMHAYWLVPAIVSKAPALPASYSDAKAAVSLSFATLGHALLLQQPHWPLNLFGKVSNFSWYFFILPFCAFSLLLVNKLKSLTNFFLLCALGSVFLIKGNSPPLGEVYLWLFTNIPGFQLFRDPTKFFVIASFAYAILIANSLSMLIKRVPALEKLILVMGIIYLMISTHPVWSGQTSGLFSNNANSSPYFQNAEILKQDNSYGKVVWIPTRALYGYSSTIHPVTEATNLLKLRPFAIGTVGTYETLNYIREAPFMGDIMDIFGVEYLAYPQPSSFTNLSDEQTKYYEVFLSQLKNLPWVEKEISPTPVTMLKTARHQDLFFVANRLWHVIGSDRIYGELSEFDRFDLSKNVFVFAQEKLNLIDTTSTNPIILYKKSLTDLFASMLPPQSYFFPASQLTPDPDSTSWWKRNTSDLISWRGFLQEKYSIDNLDFDYQGGWAVAEGAVEKTFSVKANKGDIVLIRYMKSSKGGEVELLNGDEVIAKLNSKIVQPPVYIKLTGHEDVSDIVTEYEEATFEWEEVAALPVDIDKITIKSRGEINVINALAFVRPNTWDDRNQHLTQRIILWHDLSTEERKALFDSNLPVADVTYQRLAPTHYKVSVSGLAGPALLVFSQSYNPFWTFENASSRMAYSSMNSFSIERDGVYDVYFAPQQYVHIGLVISGIGALLISVYFLYNATNAKKH